MQQVYTINDLPKFSKWPEILLGSNMRSERNIGDIHREFEKEKWGSLLNSIKNLNKPFTIEEVDDLYVKSDTKVLAYQNHDLKLVSFKETQKVYMDIVAETIQPYINECSAIVDLGCGYGSIILKLAARQAFKKIPLYAADYSLSGIAIAQKVADHNNIHLRTGLCNFLDTDLLKFDIPNGALLFTSYSMCYQKKYPNGFISNLIKYKPARVINFEPCYEHFDATTLWGLLGRRYIEYNHYNIDILSYFKEQERINKIRIDDIKPFVHGVNPLLIASIFNWRPL